MKLYYGGGRRKNTIMAEGKFAQPGKSVSRF